MTCSRKIFAAFGVFFLSVLSAQETTDRIKFVAELKMDCPLSPELQVCMDSVPKQRSETFEEWRDSLVKNLQNLILLLESGKINSGQWSVQPEKTSCE